MTDDETLHRAGIDRATTLAAALDFDADNLYVTVASKSMRPDLQIIARARASPGAKLEAPAWTAGDLSSWADTGWRHS